MFPDLTDGIDMTERQKQQREPFEAPAPMDPQVAQAILLNCATIRARLARTFRDGAVYDAIEEIERLAGRRDA